MALPEEESRQKGFVNDQDSGVICRYKIQGIIVDIMPTIGTALGFSNRWYQQGFHHSFIWEKVDEKPVRLFDAAHFIASKIEAYNNRGKGDGRSSTDFKDIVYVLNNRSGIWGEFASAPENVRDFLKTFFGNLPTNKYLSEWIGAHLEYSEQSRVKIIVESMKGFVEGR